jgi:hypothetical protein
MYHRPGRVMAVDDEVFARFKLALDVGTRVGEMA